MKKIAIALLAIASFTTANAQQEHSVLLYGNAGFNTTTNPDNTTNTHWHVTPGVGYQFDKHWVGGIALSWSQVANKDSAGNKTNTNNYKAGLFGRYIHYWGGSHFYCFPQLNIGYQGQYTAEPNGPTTNKATGMYATLTPNIGYMFGCGFSAYASYGSLGYNTLKADGASNATKTFNFSLDNSFTFGLSKNFGCGKMKHKHHDANAEMRSMPDTKDSDDDSDKPAKKKKHHKDSDNDE